MVYDGRNSDWVEASKSMAGLLRYGKHRGRVLQTQHSGWVAISDLANAMDVPEWVISSIVVGSLGYKSQPRFVARDEDGILYVRPAHFENQKTRNQAEAGKGSKGGSSSWK